MDYRPMIHQSRRGENRSVDELWSISEATNSDGLKACKKSQDRGGFRSAGMTGVNFLSACSAAIGLAVQSMHPSFANSTSRVSGAMERREAPRCLRGTFGELLRSSPPHSLARAMRA